MTSTILILSDGRPGHYNQSHGLFAGIDSSLTQRRMFELPAPHKPLKHLVLAAFLLARHSAALLRLLYYIYYGKSAPAVSERVIVSTGGDTLVANLLLAALYRIPNIFVGKPSFYTRLGVRLLVTSTGQPVPGRVVVMPLGPVVIPDHEPHQSGSLRHIAVLLGGDSTEYRYTKADYQALAENLNALCQQQGLRLLLTTSRRTSPDGESILQQTLDPAVVEDNTWYNSAPRPISQEYCKRADVILCSEDSGTMLVESLSWHKPVLGFHPRHRRTTVFYDNFLAGLANCHVQFCAISELSSQSLADLPTCTPPDMSPLRNAVIEILSTR